MCAARDTVGASRVPPLHDFPFPERLPVPGEQQASALRSLCPVLSPVLHFRQRQPSKGGSSSPMLGVWTLTTNFRIFSACASPGSAVGVSCHSSALSGGFRSPGSACVWRASFMEDAEGVVPCGSVACGDSDLVTHGDGMSPSAPVRLSSSS